MSQIYAFYCLYYEGGIFLLYLDLIESESDKATLEELYNAYHKRMWYLANEMLHDKFDAEDAVHNAFLGIANNLNAIDSVDSDRTKNYCLTAVRNSAINIFYKRTEKSTISIEEAWSVEDERALEEICLTESNDYIINAIENLPLLYREILYSYYIEDCSYKQLAKKSGRKQATIRKQVERGKKMLVEILKEGKLSYEKI